MEMTKKKFSEAKSAISHLSLSDRNAILSESAKLLVASAANILQANKRDFIAAKEAGISGPMLERLALDPKKLAAIVHGVKQVSELPDPLNRTLSGWQANAGFHIDKVSVPIGAILSIFESRPNVAADVAALCIKSGNVAILKGGKEAQNTNNAIISCFKMAMQSYDLPDECLQFLSAGRDQNELKTLLNRADLIDLVIPRGGEGLIRFVSENAKMPVLKHDRGVCHIFAERSCDIKSAVEIVVNAKTSRPSTCNALECLLIDSGFDSEEARHKAASKSLAPDAVFAAKFLPLAAQALRAKNTEIHACRKSAQILEEEGIPCKEIKDDDEYNTEFGENKLNIRIVDGLGEALEHIAEYSSGHSEGILTRDQESAEEFLNRVESACVFVNTSTRFADGGEFGFGAEVGISTAKIHARGPMGIESLTTYKYKIRGNGQIR